jgi:clan AA aspartic protease
MKMGQIYAKIRLSNPRRTELAAVDVDALVDTGAITLCIPEHVAIQLGLETLEEREVTTADGKRALCPYVGPVQVTFENRNSFSGALVLGDAVLMGSIPIEDMDLIIHPASRTLVKNPDSPNIPSVLVK